jgi:hypothetical protein
MERDATLHVDEELPQQYHGMTIDMEQAHKRPRLENEPNGTPEEILLKYSTRRDRAIANYYKRLTINNDIQFYQDMLQEECFGEALKRNIKSKLTGLLQKKFEDKYEDIVV